MEWEVRQIEQLLESYFEGTTTLQEEKILKQYFSSSQVAPHLESYRSLFAYFKQEQTTQFTRKEVIPTSKNNWYRWMAAASVVVLLGIGIYTLQHQEVPEQTVAQNELGTYTTPEQAFEETQKALAMVSGHLNTGIESMGYLNEYENSKNQVFKQ